MARIAAVEAGTEETSPCGAIAHVVASNIMFGEANMFERGKLYHRQNDLHARFGGNRQSGIAP